MSATLPPLLPRNNFIRKPAKVSLAGRTHVDLFDNRLEGDEGANIVVEKIRRTKGITRLILGLNKLGDLGCIRLFAFLRSEEGRKLDHITELSLNSNNVGNVGLLALSEWLRGHQEIRELHLQNNLFTPSENDLQIFASSINVSRLHTLSMNTNRQLSDAFAAIFLPELHSPHLRDLQLSDIGLTPSSRKHVAAFVKTCHIHSLKLNANTLGERGVTKIVDALESNYALKHVELLANRLSGDQHDSSPSSSSDDDKSIVKAMRAASTFNVRALDSRIKTWTTRNEQMQRLVHADALRLLRYARPILMESWWQQQHQSTSTGVQISVSDMAVSEKSRRAYLPPELYLKILDYLAPALSRSQRSRIRGYAWDRRTLPTLQLQLPGVTSAWQRTDNRCIPDPTSGAATSFSAVHGTPAALSVSPLAISGGGVRTPVWGVTPVAGSSHRCANGCLGGFRCRKEEVCTQWLEQVGCFWYEP